MGLAFFLGACIFVSLGEYGLYLWSKRQWNGGICAETGDPWVYLFTDDFGKIWFGTDSRVIWVWPNVTKKS